MGGFKATPSGGGFFTFEFPELPTIFREGAAEIKN
jgi:hypothetical protein